jgi:DNA-binding transcriptional LysR family regulator
MDASKLARVSLTLLRSFEAAARHLSFSRAAIELGRSQATLSVQVRELERQLDVRLLDRTTRTVALTDAGNALAQGLAEGFQAIEAGLDAAREFANNRKGRVVVACVPSLAGVRLPTILAKYRQKDAVTQIDIEELTYVEMVDALAHGRVDFGVGPCVDPPPPTITFTVASDDPLCILMPTRHEMAGQDSVPLKKMQDLTLIFLKGTAPLQASLKDAAAAEGIKLSSRTKVRQVNTAIGLVRAGVGVAIVPRLALPDEMDPELVALPIVHPDMTRRTGILTSRGRQLGSTAAKLSRYVSGALANAADLTRRDGKDK